MVWENQNSENKIVTFIAILKDFFILILIV